MQSTNTNPVRSQSQWIDLRDAMRDNEVRVVSGVRVLRNNAVLYFEQSPQSGSFTQIAYGDLPAHRAAPTLQALQTPYELDPRMARAAESARGRRSQARTQAHRDAAYLAIDGQADPQSLAFLENRWMPAVNDEEWDACVIKAAREKARAAYNRQDVTNAEVARFYSEVTDEEVMRFYVPDGI